VKVFMVDLVDDQSSDQGTQLLQIDHKASLRIRKALHCHDELEVMAMPVDIGARSEYLEILFVRPVRVPKLVGGVEVFFAGDVNHRLLKFAAKLGKRIRIRNLKA